jgi:hypothetical protein
MHEGTRKTGRTRARVRARNDSHVRLVRLEQAIKSDSSDFVVAGEALDEIRGSQLYHLAGFPAFDPYVRERLDMSRAYAYRKIAAARVIRVLSEGGRLPLPMNEAQARELGVLAEDPAMLREVWLTVLSESETAPTAATVRAVVARFASNR